MLARARQLAGPVYISRSPTGFGCSCHLSLFESQTSRRHILTNHIIKRWFENKPLWLFREQQRQKRVGTANVWQNASSSNYVQLPFFFLRKTTFSYLDGLSFVTSSFVSTRFDLWYCWFWQDKHRHWYLFTSYMQHAVQEGDGRWGDLKPAFGAVANNINMTVIWYSIRIRKGSRFRVETSTRSSKITLTTIFLL